MRRDGAGNTKSDISLPLCEGHDEGLPAKGGPKHVACAEQGVYPCTTSKATHEVRHNNSVLGVDDLRPALGSSDVAGVCGIVLNHWS